MKIEHILWPTDFSETSEVALSHVRRLSEDHDAEVHVLHVMEDIIHHEGWYGVFSEDHMKQLMEKAEKRAWERLDQICVRYLDGCRLFHKHVAVGDPASEILKFIENQPVDIVVMATRGERETFDLGSVTERVVRRSRVPVTTIPLRNR
jgi:nucleotide-binding universal stress UspA family protein